MRLRRLNSLSEMEQEIDDYITIGYTAERRRDAALVKKINLFRTVDEVLLRLNNSIDTVQTQNEDTLSLHEHLLRRCRSCGAPKRCKHCGTPQPYDGRYCETCGKFLLDFIECVDVDAAISFGIICIFMILSAVVL